MLGFLYAGRGNVSTSGQPFDRQLDWAIYGYDAEPLTRTTFTDTTGAAESHFGEFPAFQAAAAAACTHHEMPALRTDNDHRTYIKQRVGAWKAARARKTATDFR